MMEGEEERLSLGQCHPWPLFLGQCHPSSPSNAFDSQEVDWLTTFDLIEQPFSGKYFFLRRKVGNSKLVSRRRDNFRCDRQHHRALFLLAPTKEALSDRAIEDADKKGTCSKDWWIVL